MTITIKKDSGKKEVEKALKEIKHPEKKLSDFYGKLKGGFADGLTYQKKVRDEWD